LPAQSVSIEIYCGIARLPAIRHGSCPIWRPPHIEFKSLNFGHRILIIVLIYFSVQSLIKQLISLKMAI